MVTGVTYNESVGLYFISEGQIIQPWNVVFGLVTIERSESLLCGELDNALWCCLQLKKRYF
jgi:hypothetical protein